MKKLFFILTCLLFLTGCEVTKRSYKTATFSIGEFGNQYTKDVVLKLTEYQLSNDYKNFYETTKKLDNKKIGINFLSEDRFSETVNYAFRDVPYPQLETVIQDNYGSLVMEDESLVDDNNVVIKSYTIVLPKFKDFKQDEYEKYVKERTK